MKPTRRQLVRITYKFKTRERGKYKERWNCIPLKWFWRSECGCGRRAAQRNRQTRSRRAGRKRIAGGWKYGAQADTKTLDKMNPGLYIKSWCMILGKLFKGTIMPENGIVYVLSNPAMPGLYKIGITGREELRQRLRELYARNRTNAESRKWLRGKENRQLCIHKQLFVKTVMLQQQTHLHIQILFARNVVLKL